MILLLEPMTLVGTIFGVYIHHHSNDDILFIVLFAIIFLIAIRTLIKGYDTYNTTQLYNYICYDEVKDNNETIHTNTISYPSKTKMLLLTILVVSTNSISSALYFIASSSLLPFKDMLIIILTLMFVILLIMITLIIRLIIIKENNSNNYNKKLAPQRLAIYPVFGMAAGIIAGALGIGGGLIKAPLLLAILDENVEASATSSTMVFLTSVTALIGLNTKYTNDNDNTSNSPSADLFPTLLFMTGLIFTIIGQKVSEYYIRQNTSLITISMGVAMLLSLALLVLQKIMIMN